MNFKKNFKRFFTLSRSAEGFTLVELIVVIAILGILTSVAVPAYSTYIKSAGESVDKQSLAVMNNALAVACAYAGVDPATGTAGLSMKWDDEKTFAGLQGSATQTFALAQSEDTTTEDKDDIATTFNNSLDLPIVFKHYNSSQIQLSGGQFVGPDSEGNYSVNYGSSGGKINLNTSDLSNLKNSTFGTQMTVQELLDKVDMTTDLAAELATSDLMNTLLSSDAFIAAATNALNLQEGESLNDKLLYLAKQMTTANPSMSTDDAINKVKANAAVLFAAQSTAGMTADQVVNALKTGTISSDITSNLSNGNAATAMSSAALAYGMYTAYANSTGKGVAVDTSKPGEVMDALDDPGFLAYVNSEQGKTDAQAYLSALNMINASTQDPNAVSDLMVNGFNDEELATLIQNAMK